MLNVSEDQSQPENSRSDSIGSRLLHIYYGWDLPVEDPMTELNNLSINGKKIDTARSERLANIPNARFINTGLMVEKGKALDISWKIHSITGRDQAAFLGYVLNRQISTRKTIARSSIKILEYWSDSIKIEIA